MSHLKNVRITRCDGHQPFHFLYVPYGEARGRAEERGMEGVKRKRDHNVRKGLAGKREDTVSVGVRNSEIKKGRDHELMQGSTPFLTPWKEERKMTDPGIRFHV